MWSWACCLTFLGLEAFCSNWVFTRLIIYAVWCLTLGGPSGKSLETLFWPSEQKSARGLWGVGFRLLVCCLARSIQCHHLILCLFFLILFNVFLRNWLSGNLLCLKLVTQFHLVPQGSCLIADKKMLDTKAKENLSTQALLGLLWVSCRLSHPLSPVTFLHSSLLL